MSFKDARKALTEAHNQNTPKRFATMGKIFVVSDKDETGILKDGSIQFQRDGIKLKKGDIILEKETGNKFEYDDGHRHVVADAFLYFVANVKEPKKQEEKKPEEPKKDPTSS